MPDLLLLGVGVMPCKIGAHQNMSSVADSTTYYCMITVGPVGDLGTQKHTVSSPNSHRLHVSGCSLEVNFGDIT